MLCLENAVRRIDLKLVEKTLRKKVLNIEVSIFLLVIFITIYAVIFSYFTLMKNYAFGTYAWDLGIFNQALWTTLQDGRFFYYTCELLINPSGSFFGIHFSPILFIILPFYSIYPSIETLLILQSFVLALGALPLYKLVKEVLRYRLAGLAFALVYLLYPSTQGINWFDFHVQSFFPLFFFSALYFLEKENWKTYLLFIILALMVEEHASIIVFFMGIYYLLHDRKRIISVLKTQNFRSKILLVPALTASSAILWYFMTLWIRNSFFPINPDFLSEFKAIENWSVLGVKEPLAIPLYIFLYPAKAIAALEYDFLAKIAYILVLFGPLAFRSFRAPKYLIPTIPWFLYSLFSNNPSYYSIHIQYPAYLISFIFVAAIYAFKDDKTKLMNLKKGFIVCLLCSLAAFFLASPLSPRFHNIMLTEHEKLVHEVLTYVPLNASVMTQSNIFPHVSSKVNAYVIPVIHLIWRGKTQEFQNFTNETLEKVDYVLVDFKTDATSTQFIFTLLQRNNQFKVFVYADSIILFKRDYNDSALILEPYYARYNFQNLALYSGNKVEDPTSESGIVLHFNGTSGPSPMFWHGPRALLPPGKYNLTVRLKIETRKMIGNEIFLLDICSNNGQTLIFTQTFRYDEDLSKADWRDNIFYINIDKPLVDFEVRGVRISNQTNIYLDYIEIKQFNSINPEVTP